MNNIKKNYSFHSLTGRNQAKKIFSYFLESKNFPTSVLLSGSKGSGKKEFLYSFLQNLFCENSNACGSCSACVKIRQRAHPDLIIFPEGQNIKIGKQSEPETDSIRYIIQKKLPFQPIEAEFRVIVFEQAELIRPEAETALLKSLEDGPSHTLFFLLTSKEQQIKNTIKSRSLIIPFQSFNYEELKQRTKAEDIENFQKIKNELENIFDYPFGQDLEYIIKSANYKSYFKDLNIPVLLKKIHSALLNKKDRLELEDLLLNWSSKGSLDEPYTGKKGKWEGDFLNTFRYLINLYLPFLGDCKNMEIITKRKYLFKIFFTLLQNLDDYTAGVFPYALSVFFADLLYLDELVGRGLGK